MKIATNKPDKRWLKAARASGFTLRTGDPEFLPLKKLLLKIGGWSVCTAFEEPYMSDLLSRGQQSPGKSKLIPATPCACHFNCAYFWNRTQRRCSICTGYALTKDGMWRKHSWLVSPIGRVYETTVKRIQYFGYVLTEAESEAFFRRFGPPEDIVKKSA